MYPGPWAPSSQGFCLLIQGLKTFKLIVTFSLSASPGQRRMQALALSRGIEKAIGQVIPVRSGRGRQFQIGYYTSEADGHSFSRDENRH